MAPPHRMISPSATNPSISDLQDSDYVFRTAVPDSLQGQVLAREVRRRNLSRVAALAVNNAYGTGLLEVFRAQFQAAGGTLTHAATFEENRPAYRGELATAAAPPATAAVDPSRCRREILMATRPPVGPARGTRDPERGGP